MHEPNLKVWGRVMSEAVILEDENGDLILVFPQGLMEQVGWKIGDTLIWEETFICGDDEFEDCNGFTLRKKEVE